MKKTTRTDYISRDHILKLLSDTEIAAVATAETASKLPDGEEFIDLERFAEGVQKTPPQIGVMGRVLPKKSVQPATWEKIIAALPSPSSDHSSDRAAKKVPDSSPRASDGPKASRIP